jgi:hypothetical protein
MARTDGMVVHDCLPYGWLTVWRERGEVIGHCLDVGTTFAAIASAVVRSGTSFESQAPHIQH